MTRPGLAANELQRIGILLLRHQAAAGRRGVRELEESELLRREEDQVLGQPAEVHHSQRRRVQERRDEIAVARRVDAVEHDARETETRGEGVHVDRVARAGNGAGTERQLVGFGEHRREPAMIAAQRGGVREEEVRGQHRLRAAQVRVRRHQRIGRGLGLVGEHGRRAPRCAALDLGNPALQVEPEIDRDLLVARPAGVQAAAGVANPRHELAFDERVHVLVVARGSDVKKAGSVAAREAMSSSAARMTDASARASTPARSSPSAHARLPRTSSSNSRRSNRNDAPNSNSPASGSPANRPDQRCAMSVSHRFRPGGRLARRGLNRQSPDPDESFRGAVVVEIAGVVGRQVVLVQAER